MSDTLKIFGFTLLRNAVKYDYCFQESLASLQPLVESIYIALGKGEDETEKLVSNLPNIKIINTIWDESLRESGLILSQQTNLALEILRADETIENAWAIYLQADEVIHENDYELIKKDISYANDNGFDAIAFRYKHFWLNHNQLAVGKKWYPIEVRAIKLHSNIKSIKDAQGFEGCQKVFCSNAFIYHYGHVREESIYRLKKADFHKLYNADEQIGKATAKEEKRYRKGRFLPYFASHPTVMEPRILRFGDVFKPDQKTEIWILAEEKSFDSALVNNILAGKIHWISKLSQCPSNKRRMDMVIFKPNWWQNMLYSSKVKNRPDSYLGQDWTNEFILILKLSEKQVGVGS